MATATRTTVLKTAKVSLKIIVSHGGGAIPHQIGRYQAFFGRHFEAYGGFDVEFKKFYFDTVLYNLEGIELLLKITGSDRCMFGPRTWIPAPPVTRRGKMLDDLKPVIESIPGITEQDKKNVFEDVPKKGIHTFQGVAAPLRHLF